jgi:hypothetical protein
VYRWLFDFSNSGYLKKIRIQELVVMGISKTSRTTGFYETTKKELTVF